MARRLTQESAAAVGDNQLTTEERERLEEQACSDLAALDQERKTFNAAQTRARKSIMGGVVKGQLQMTSRDFNNFIYEEYKLKQGDDEEALRLHQLAKARAWARTPVGTQKSLFEELKLGDQAQRLNGGTPKNGAKRGARGAKNGAAAAAAEEEAETITDTIKEAAAKGFDAGSEGKNLDANPYPSGSRHHQSWAVNWKSAQNKMAEKLGQGADRLN